MNNSWVLIHLNESKDELDSIIKEYNTLDVAEFYVRMQHLYHHLNTAFNSRELDEDECFDRAAKDDIFYYEKEKFPTDLF